MATGLDLKNAIKGKGLTIEQAAKLLGISRQTLSTYLGKAKIEEELERNVKTKLKITLQNGVEETLVNQSLTDLIELLKLEKQSALKCQDIISKQQETIQTLAEIIRPQNSDHAKHANPH